MKNHDFTSEIIDVASNEKPSLLHLISSQVGNDAKKSYSLRAFINISMLFI